MSNLTHAIAKARRTIGDEECPVRRALSASYERAVDELRTNLEAVTRMIADARASGIDVNPDWLRRQARYRTLIAQAESEFLRFSHDGMRILREGRVRAVSGGAAEAWELMEAAGVSLSMPIAVTGVGAAINTPAIERVMAALSDDSPLRDILDGYGRNASQVIEERLVQGIIQGTGPREVMRQIQRELRGGYVRARLEALVRTEMMRAFNGSLEAQYAQMGDVISGYRWSAAKSSRTCLACLAMDGRIFKEYQHRMHIMCRCICSPVARGVNIPYETGPEWFARQSPDAQRIMMPSGDAFAAYQRGDVKLRDFVGHKRSKVWGSSITELSGREALRRAS